MLKEPALYVSLHFKRHQNEYYERLQRVRTHGDWEGWMDFYLDGIASVAMKATDTIAQLVVSSARSRARSATRSSCTSASSTCSRTAPEGRGPARLWHHRGDDRPPIPDEELELVSGKALFGGLVLGVLLGAGGLFGVQTLLLADPDSCAALCGAGTVCEGGVCRPAPAELDEAPAEDEDEGADKGKRRKAKRRKGKAGANAAAAGQGPPLDDDSHVPRFNPNADQSISMSDGSGRLGDSQVDRELARLDGRFQGCVRDAAARVDELGTGKVKLNFGVDGKGKVTGVNVSAPGNLKDAGVVPCVRKAVYGHEFPAFDGPVMKVSSSFTVE